MPNRGRRMSGGGYSQSALPDPAMRNPYASNGLLVRGVVTAVYVTDSTDGQPESEIAAVYCDVLVYSALPHDNIYGAQRYGSSNHPYWFLPRVLVSNDRGGLHEGRIWKPRATTQDITGATLDSDKATSPANMDGDHVLVGFMDNSLNMPVILRGIPHPKADVGNDGLDTGHRLRLIDGDAHPELHKHRGTYFGIEANGDLVFDTTRAHNGEYTDGAEPSPTNDGSNGNVRWYLQENGVFTVEINGVEEFRVDPSGTTTVGGGTLSVAIADYLETFYTTVLKVWMDTHVHPSAVGPTGPPAPSPVWDGTINSTKFTIEG